MARRAVLPECAVMPCALLHIQAAELRAKEAALNDRVSAGVCPFHLVAAIFASRAASAARATASSQQPPLYSAPAAWQVCVGGQQAQGTGAPVSASLRTSCIAFACEPRSTQLGTVHPPSYPQLASFQEEKGELLGQVGKLDVAMPLAWPASA